MNFNRNRAQLRCENLLHWGEKGFKGFSLDNIQAKELVEDLREDAKDFYYKGTLSICEAISSIHKRLFSWATIKLYYSVFYFLRATLASKTIAVVRQKGYFYLIALAGEIPQKSPGVNNRNTHECTCAIAKKLLQSSDVLLSNSIGTENAYNWLREKRERVHYREREFHEPGVPDFWEEIAHQSDLDCLISMYIDDSSYVYCFQDDHACLALPLKRWFLTKKDLKDVGISVVFPDERKKLLENLLTLSGKKITKINELI